MKLRLFLLTALLLAGGFGASAQWAPDALTYKRGHLRDGKQVLTDLEVREIIGEEIFQETYVGARKQYKAGLGLLIGGGVVTLSGAIICNRAESFIKDRGKGTLWAIIKTSWNKGSMDDVGLDQAAEDVTKGIVWYFCGAGVSYVGTTLLKFGIPFYAVGRKRLEWIADDYNRRNAPSLEITATPFGPGLRLQF